MEIDRVNGFNPDELKIKLVKNSFNLVSANSTPESLPAVASCFIQYQFYFYRLS